LNLARLNHILIPTTKEERDRLRDTRFARIFLAPVARAWVALSDEGRGLLGLSLLASLVGLDVLHGQNHLLWAGAFSLLVASLLVRPFFPLRGVRLEVDGPARVEAGGVARFRVSLINESRRRHRALRVRRPFLPWDGSWLGGASTLPELPAGARRAVTVRARFVARGHHHIDSFAAAALVPLGLAVGPARESRGTRFVVVPRIAKVARIDLPERMRHQPGGIALASHTGESMELVGVRPFRDGDRIRDLHARRSARFGMPMVREFQQEYFSRFGVVLDPGTESVHESDLEAAVSLCAGVLAHWSSGDALVDFDLLRVGERPLTVGRSLGGIDQALDALAEVEPGRDLAVATVLARMRPRLETLSALVLITTQWDDAHRQILAGIEHAGVPCLAVVVGEGPSMQVEEATATLRHVSREMLNRACEGQAEIVL
jgi:uncharacterized protein (DUF58 family)